jgi:hypothetical protein
LIRFGAFLDKAGDFQNTTSTSKKEVPIESLLLMLYCRMLLLCKKTHTNPMCLFSSVLFVLSRFWAFLNEGSSKTPYNTFYKKSMSNLIYPKKNHTVFFLGFSCIDIWALLLGKGSSKIPRKKKNI